MAASYQLLALANTKRLLIRKLPLMGLCVWGGGGLREVLISNCCIHMHSVSTCSCSLGDVHCALPLSWWEARVHFNARLQECLGNARLKQCLQCVEYMHLQSKETALTFPGTVLLILGRRLHKLPGLGMPRHVRGSHLILTRSPSLWFVTALVCILIRWPGRTPPGCNAMLGGGCVVPLS